ncbi:purine and uridine phosphorylase [Annulohypoxylon stygium]|nr:purine and uridine phosphorylase [Annulohypoxylon stygium]
MAALRPEDYSIIWIAPLEIEARAALDLLDTRHNGKFLMGRGDDYVFKAGEMCGHNIVIATLPAGQEYGTGSAAALASQAKRFFPNFWFGLLVGVAAGLPNLERNPPRDIRLGDILVSIPDVNRSRTVAYDLGKETGQGEIELLRHGHILAETEPVVRSAIGSIKLNSPNESELFLPLYRDDDGAEVFIERSPRPDTQRTLVWYGPIGSGDKLMKNAARRDELRDKYDLIGLEMEAAGTMNRVPVGVIRAACDYGDKHKNKEWQPYAAAMAAAYAKAVLSQITPRSQPDQREDQQRRKRHARDSTDSDSDSGDDGRNKRSSFYGAGRARSSRGNVVFRGKGNQSVGSGSFSIGGNQTIN